MDKRIQIVVKGRVQGVFFRDCTLRKAIGLGLRGTVRNRRDGTVEVIAQGDEARLLEMEKWCWEGSPHSKVTEVIRKDLADFQDYPDFRVLY
jgi:acylphosphatase